MAICVGAARIATDNTYVPITKHYVLVSIYVKNLMI